MKPKKKSKKPLKKKKVPESKLLHASSSSSGRKEKGVSSSPPRVVKKRKLYAKEQLQAAYKAVRDSNISVNAAAKQYGVPLTTLRDRVDGRISIDTTRPGPPQLMAKEEEAEIAHFLHTMARYGYRYTRLELGEIATDQAVEKGKKNPRANGLTMKWVDNFVGRWPSIRELSCKYKNKADAEQTVRTYFDEIKKIIDRYKLLDKSDRIFNIMEIGLHTDHSIMSSSGHQYKTENVSHTTMLACGSVSGKVMAPFFVFQAARLRPEMMRGVPSNVNAAVSDTGKCTPQIFRRYLNEHFLPQTQRVRDSDPILVLMDGCRSHIFVTLAEWGRVNNVIFSFVPALTTHLLQPLEVECAELIQRKYESVCRRYLKSYSGPCVSRNCIAELACQAYFKVLNRHSVVHAFKKAGVYPDISSDESEEEEEAAREDSYSRSTYVKEEEEEENTRDEVVFTGDLVVGHNEEITGEEVVQLLPEEQSEPGTSASAAKEEELVITPEGQLMMNQGGKMVAAPSGHIVIHGGEIFVNRTESGLSRLQPLQLVEETQDADVTVDDDLCKMSPLKQQCILADSPFEAEDSDQQSDISLVSAAGSKKFDGRDGHYYLSASDNNSSGSSTFSSHMEQAGLTLEASDHTGALSVIVKQEGIDNIGL